MIQLLHANTDLDNRTDVTLALQRENPLLPRVEYETQLWVTQEWNAGSSC